MMNPTAAVHELRRNLDQLTALTGETLPTDLATLLANVDAFLALDHANAAAELAAGIRAGAPAAELLPWFTFATASATGALGTARDSVLRLIVPELRELAGRAAREAHATIAQRFNEAAAQLTADVRVAPASITAEQAVGAAPAVRKAYLARADQLATLDTLCAAMRLCAELARGVRPNTDQAASLCVDFDRVPADRNRETWDLIDGSRFDWLALAALDVLGARPLDAPAAPRHPGLQERWERNGIGHGRRLYDPVAQAYVA